MCRPFKYAITAVTRTEWLRRFISKNISHPRCVPVETLPIIIVDVGHNPHAAKYLSEKLTTLKRNIEGKMIAVCGMLKDKDANGVFAHLTSIIDEWRCCFSLWIFPHRCRILGCGGIKFTIK